MILPNPSDENDPLAARPLRPVLPNGFGTHIPPSTDP